MNHEDALALISPEEKAALLQKDTRKALMHLVQHFGAIALTGTYIAFQWPLWGLVMIPHGVLLMFLFTLAHECTHATPFGPRWLNNLVGHVISPLIALPFTWFRYFHLAHHKHTNDPDHDPELAGGGRPKTWGAYLMNLTGGRYWRLMLRTLWINARGDMTADYLPERKHLAMVIEAQAILGLYVFALVALPFMPVLLWIWIVPVLLGQPFLRLYLLAEHGHCPPVANMLENTRTTLTNRFVHWLAWNMPYHAEHHAHPNVPFHQLPALHAHLRPHLKSVSDGYGAFHRAYLRALGR